MKRVLFLASLAAALILAVGGMIKARSGRAAAELEMVTIERGDIESVVSATGTLSAVGTVDVGTQVSGTIARVFDDDPLGQRIRIRNTSFKVVGVLAEKGQAPNGSDYDDLILVPATTALYRLAGGKHIDATDVSAPSPEVSEAARVEITSIMRESHKIGPGEDDDFQVRSQAEFLEAATSTRRVMTLLVGAVAAVSLVVGGIGIMNIMLVSVTERTREIGIRLAVGARARDVLAQFLTESVVLSLLGGTIGVVLAYAVTLVLNRLVGMTTVVSPAVVLVAFGFAGAVGVFFGFYPARKPANMNPIEALRYE